MEITMKTKTRKLTAVLHDDRQLLKLFSGIILTAVALLSIAVTAGIWYL
jgi:hypothetical protein